MTFAKDSQQPSSRPCLHRPVVTHSRTNSHSLIGLSLNSSHRVTRRKSVSGTANRAAITAALDDAMSPTADSTRAWGLATPPANSGAATPASAAMVAAARRQILSGTASGATTPVAGSMPTLGGISSGVGSSIGSNIRSAGGAGDGLGQLGGIVKVERIDYGMDEALKGASLEEVGRLKDPERNSDASDGLLTSAKETRKSSRAELRCDKCGKGYKHSSCLTKHLWEHTPGWTVTSKLLISKHQQVQLLEAASVLVSMNTSKDGATPPDSAKDLYSDAESYSPTASGYSDQHDRLSSADTTPPPPPTDYPRQGMPGGYEGRAYELARSYQSVGSPNSPFANSMRSNAAFGHNRQYSHDNRPISSGRNHTGADDQDLAAAVKLLSCSHNSGNVVGQFPLYAGQYASTLPRNAPPVPPLPMQYLGDASKSWAGQGLFASLPGRQPESFARGEARVSPRKAMEESDSIMGDYYDEYDYSPSRARSDEDDDGVFGHMEE